ncbi:MAG TPA: hypothetical protein DCZ10_15915 [Pelotomaculum sp.]|nr:hypothetical protein [Pelotomaculum sp.]
MSKSEFTPGPWKARDYTNNEGDVWIDCNAFACKGKGKSLGGTLATVHKNGTGKGTMEANARLIAAAPDMYEALKRIMDELPAKRDWLDPVSEQMALAALAKAEGE